MLTGFEKYTKPLDGYEGTVVMPQVKNLLIQTYARNNPIPNSEIRRVLKSKGIKAGPARVRKIIQYLRTKEEFLLDRPRRRLYLIASAKGYYLTDNAAKAQKWILSVKQRTYSMVHTVMCMEKQIKKGDK